MSATIKTCETCKELCIDGAATIDGGQTWMCMVCLFDYLMNERGTDENKTKH